METHSSVLMWVTLKGKEEGSKDAGKNKDMDKKEKVLKGVYAQAAKKKNRCKATGLSHSNI